ncbi:MAG: hypothetical protein L6R45_12250 [Anaerolineae bacterium]|nr:hypothetical protein [Anaerolineae bacterium]
MDADCQRADFSPDLFVGRETELADLIRWATADTVPRRLRTIVGPPGYGKSWLLCQLEKRLRDSRRHGRDLFLLRIPTAEVISRQQIKAWLPSLIKTAQDVRSGEIRDHAPTDPPETIIARLLEDLCQNCSPTLRPILLVDALDELLDNERRELEKNLLEQFWLNPGVRIVMAFRDDLGLKSPNLRRGEIRTPLQIFEPETGQKQLQKLAAENVPPQPADLLPLLPPYLWTHPQINVSLYEIAQREAPNRQPLAFTTDELKSCWVSLIKDKVDQALLSQDVIENDLRAISAGEDTWTLETFAALGQYAQGEALDHLQSLMALSIVSQAGGQRYQVVDGLRELLRAEIKLREKEEEQK